MTTPSAREAREIIAALRTGVVPAAGLHHFATGLDDLMGVIDAELQEVADSTGSGRAKWIRGGYGSGKTFATRLICWRARKQGFATSEVQISITDTPLHRLETVYRRMMSRLTTDTDGEGAFSGIVATWIYELGEAVSRLKGIEESDPAFPAAVEQRLEDRLSALSARNPTFARVLRAYHSALDSGDFSTAQGLLGWLAGEPNTAMGIKRAADVKSEVDGSTALTFMRGVLQLLRESNYRGWVVVLDEVETIQRMRSDVRDKALNALRQLVDMLLGGELPGMYLVVTGTPEFFEGYKGLKELAPLADRVATTFHDDPRFDNLRAPQVRLQPFDQARLASVGRAVRDLYPTEHRDRVVARVDDGLIDDLVDVETAGFGGRVDIVPRLFLRRLVDIMDRVDQYPDFDPRVDVGLKIDESMLRPEELAARRGDPGDLPPPRARRLD